MGSSGPWCEIANPTSHLEADPQVAGWESQWDNEAG